MALSLFYDTMILVVKVVVVVAIMMIQSWLSAHNTCFACCCRESRGQRRRDNKGMDKGWWIAKKKDNEQSTCRRECNFSRHDCTMAAVSLWASYDNDTVSRYCNVSRWDIVVVDIVVFDCIACVTGLLAWPAMSLRIPILYCCCCRCRCDLSSLNWVSNKDPNRKQMARVESLMVCVLFRSDWWLTHYTRSLTHKHSTFWVSGSYWMMLIGIWHFQWWYYWYNYWYDRSSLMPLHDDALGIAISLHYIYSTIRAEVNCSTLNHLFVIYQQSICWTAFAKNPPYCCDWRIPISNHPSIHSFIRLFIHSFAHPSSETNTPTKNLFCEEPNTTNTSRCKTEQTKWLHLCH